MIASLNRAYEIKENRRRWRIVISAFGLTISLEVIGLITRWVQCCMPAWRGPLCVSILGCTLSRRFSGV